MAEPGTSRYSRVSIKAQLLCDVEVALEVAMWRECREGGEGREKEEKNGGGGGGGGENALCAFVVMFVVTNGLLCWCTDPCCPPDCETINSKDKEGEIIN